MGVCVSATVPPWRQKPQEAKETGGRGKEKKSRAAEMQGCHPQPPSIGLPALPQPLSPEVPNKPWEGQRRAGGGGEREVTELENFG